ncbi:hypothetical protein PoB_006697800 [Plakobranchus ocellatus]|uniref:Uncharacterized protein n=1 Tax=Plakobranchus ocellatus TaxID=259542 RepID=A0AAV4D8H9_9GAST|nr:hypothetical protein PoB_006697800 [Plakobranchus ocellatus]
MLLSAVQRRQISSHVLFDYFEKTAHSHVLFSCGELDRIRGSDWSNTILQETLWSNKENKVPVKATRPLRVFIRRVMCYELPAECGGKRRAVPPGSQLSKNRELSEDCFEMATGRPAG